MTLATRFTTFQGYSFLLFGFLFLICLTTLLATPHSQASNSIILQSGSYSLSIGENVSIFEDTQGTLSFQDMSDREIQLLFSKIHTDYLKIGPTDSVIWLRVSLQNPLSSHQMTVVTFSNPHVDDITPYHLSFSAPDEDHNSITQINSSHRQSQAFILDIAPQSVESFLFRIETDAFLNTSIELKSLDQYVKKDSFTNLVAGIIFGLSIASLILYFRSYLLRPNPFVLLAICYSLAVMVGMISGLGLLISYWNLDRDLSRIIESFSHAMALFIYIITIWKFDWQGKLARRVIKALTLMHLSILLLTLFLPANHIEMSIHGGGLISSIMVLILLTQPSKHREFHPAFSIGAFSYALSTAIILINAHNLVSIDALTIWIMILLPLIGLILFFNMVYNINSRQRALKTKHSSKYDPSLLTYVANELKAPTEDITHIYELLSNTPLSVQQRDYISKIALSNQSIGMTSQSLINLVEIKNDQLNLTEYSFQVDDLLNDVVTDFQPEAKQKQVELVVDISKIPANFIVGDYFRIKLILHDLIKKILTQVENGEIYISATYRNDSQSGINFQIQFRGRFVNHKDLNNGLDLVINKSADLMAFESDSWGAYVIYHLIKHMGGKIGLDYHTPRSGSVNLFLPLALSDQIHIETSASQILELMDKKALVLAGNSVLRSVLESRLQLWKVQCDSTFSAKEAIALLRNQSRLQQPYDLIIIDQDTSNMSEFQLLEKIQQDDEITLKPQSILLTGLSSHSIDDLAKDAGFAAVINKPVSSEYLLETLIKLV